jgi:hypothetical protein
MFLLQSLEAAACLFLAGWAAMPRDPVMLVPPPSARLVARWEMVKAQLLEEADTDAWIQRIHDVRDFLHLDPATGPQPAAAPAPQRKPGVHRKGAPARVPSPLPMLDAGPAERPRPPWETAPAPRFLYPSMTSGLLESGPPQAEVIAPSGLSEMQPIRVWEPGDEDPPTIIRGMAPIIDGDLGRYLGDLPRYTD